MLQAYSGASRWNPHPGDRSLLTVKIKDTGIVIYVFGRLCFWSLQYKRNQCPRGSVMVLWTFWPRASCALGSSSSCSLILRFGERWLMIHHCQQNWFYDNQKIIRILMSWCWSSQPRCLQISTSLGWSWSASPWYPASTWSSPRSS